MEYSNEDRELESILDNNRKQALYNNNQDIQQAIERYNNAQEHSYSRSRRNFELEKKRRKRSEIVKAIATISLVAAVALPAYKIVNKPIDTPRETEAITYFESKKTTNEIINEKVLKYQRLLGVDGEKDIRIENSLGRNKSGELLVDYSPDNLANMILESSKESEVETRCVLLAAYKIINEPYQDEVIGESLQKASAISLENDTEEYNLNIIKGSTNEFLESLGYNSWEDYQLHERDNIKNLYELEISTKGKVKNG